ncbi:MAG: hypothetical protein E7554_06120 [Ruminococcaceae bacterium]|nr:hypothetical protein [Oscillospiraceae bacterium]
MNTSHNERAISADRGGTRLYNLLFPIWMLTFMPSTWRIALPVNFVVDSIVLLIMLTLLARKRGDADYKPWSDWMRAIIPTWILGFISDIVAAGFLFFWGVGPTLVLGDQSSFGGWWSRNVAEPIMANPFESFFSVLFVLLSVGLGALLVYFLNKNVALRLTKSLDVPEIKRTALVLAIATAPWTMLLPSEWFW